MISLFKQNKIFVIIILFATMVVGIVYLNIQDISESLNVSEDILLKDKIDNKKCDFEGEVLVTKVIDGDTIIVEGGEYIRLIGIDSDEFGYPCYYSAKKELENLVLNKKVILQKDISVTDKYGRCLNYVFLKLQNINVEMVKRGLAVASFYEPDVKYKAEIKYAESHAIKGRIGCKWSNLK
ncbi:MAG: hypothetical protein A2360_04835 [Candidatus Staskawiczbacteria bacterium RIFOXYB1_FULL_32_11]|uniref:TNase-like domain-containing protein n=1 Tax=Candidatus Staskawiczbacteria bacterium RIFOXYD1_FULL_32_13 TaxID=1802234 RepID=A0A1G2JKM8_9BACT|nr:MAG: nuclease [Parcubacteria group bacterium GW2011_GWC2_32_10]OGZ79743.1 MAG: hypothetical protein A2360_04835 [Candidatus Staskawiczbacteria bacterium RIFOXYB1_FULL_32_11]OGZ81038.1 MAG: hypothetical protein A2256_04275 [Candidatus Staskawiczbacteria bacterium RIFOXYA2_FULL_32_7]OGZ87664.1 MAG: hypothetical protein A2561_03125 [Candidatus Staskawiczbacteria bacterium RIFOXYD1_FULL_32_13]